jgi:transglutaminase-like putative cysteine protease
MTLERFFLLSSYGLIGASFYALVATRHLDLLTTVLFVGVLGISWLIDDHRIEWALSRRFANWMTFAWIPVAIVEWRYLRFPPAQIIMHVVLLAGALKLLQRKRAKDWLWLYLVSFCQLLFAAGLVVGVSFVLVLLVDLLMAILALVSFEIRQSEARYVNRPQRREWGTGTQIRFRRLHRRATWQNGPPRWRSLAGWALTLLVAIFVLAIPVFLTMPRLVRLAPPTGILAAEALSGFSDQVRLGEVAQIKLNPQVVMRVRVRFPGKGPPPHLSWRGVTLDHYDGQTWSQSGRRTLALRKTDNVYAIDAAIAPQGVTEQRFFLEPLTINTVFAAPRTMFVLGLDWLFQGDGDSLWTEPHPTRKLEYKVYSDTQRPTVEQLMADDDRRVSLLLRERYLQLPETLDPRMADLAEQLVRGARTKYEMVVRIERHLQSEYAYSLEMTRVSAGEPVGDFLFQVRRGHCEYFASAMVLLLRSRQIPARLVNGFQMGEYHSSSDFYTVRQSDAHSWVEVYFPHSGWVAFDPTPPAGLSQYGDGWQASLRRWREAIEMAWLEHVIGFDTVQQLTLAVSIRRWLMAHQGEAVRWWEDWVARWIGRGQEWRAWAAGLWSSGQERIRLSAPPPVPEGSGEGTGGVGPNVPGFHWLVGLLLVVLLLGLGEWGRRAHRRARLARRLRTDPGGIALLFYQQMLEKLQRHGYRRALNQTPLEFAAQVDLPQVALLTALYQKTRFGHHVLTLGEVAQVESMLRELATLPGARNRR